MAASDNVASAAAALPRLASEDGAFAPLRPRDLGRLRTPADTGDSQPHQKVPLHLALCSARCAVMSHPI